MTDTATIESFLARLRAAHPGMEVIFTRGACYELYEIMRVVWPESEPWYDFEGGHVYVKLGPWWWDIRGRHRRPPPHTLPLRRHWPGDAPHRWSRRTDIKVIDALETLKRID